MRLLFSGIFMTLFAVSTAWADSPVNFKKAYQTALAHGKTVHCSVDANKNFKKHVFLLDDDGWLKNYAVLYHTSTYECNDGNATSGYVLAHIIQTQTRSGEKFRIEHGDLFDTLPEEQYFNTRFIEKIIQNANGTFDIITSEYGKDDAQCCPSERWRHTVRIQNGKMKLVGKKLLGKNPN